MKKMTQAQGWKEAARLHKGLNAARGRRDEVAIAELEQAIEKLAD